MGFSHHRKKLQIFLLTHCCFLAFLTHAIDTITVNQSLHDSETLVSNGKKFKLGFFTPENSSYRYVGIMFNIPVTTVIWVANRETPLNDSSGTIQISGDGNLVILDGSKRIIWSSSSSSPSSSLVNSNTTAVLLNTGNLVLRVDTDNSNNNNGYVWESFKHASDSFVASLEIFADSNTNETNSLTSWRSASDPGLGSFTLTMEPVGIPECFIWKNGDPFWRSGPWNGQIFNGIPNMNSIDKHGLDIVNSYDGTAYSSFKLLNSSVLVYYLLNSYGALQEKEWSEEKGDWVVNWSSSNNACDLYGKCGAFGSCNNQDSPICKCFPGFEPKVKDEWRNGNWSNGCSRKSVLQCGRNGSVGGLGKQDGFFKMGRVKLPDRDTWFPTSEEECMSNCLSNCSCIAYSYSAGTGCMKWGDDLIDVQKFPNGVADLYIRLAFSELGGNKKDHKAIIASTVILGSLTVVVFAFFMRKLMVKYRGGKKRRNELIMSTTEETDKGHSEESMLKHNVHGSKFEDLPLFKYQTLSDATDKFDSINKLGQGGFGPVYKGKLENGQEIAVKRLAKSSNQGIKEFMNEVEVISKLQHRNLVKLIGCCVECEEKMLVYEYMHNGSLNAHLFDLHKKEFLDWETRSMIIEGICRGLLYLHRDSRLRIIHRDLKASNILLDDELNPKISDFGMARIFRLKEDEANTIRVVGTYGYMSPEYALHGIFSEKSDVYSLGILLLEIVSGRRNSSFYHEEQQHFLIEYVWELWNEEKMVNLIDPVISVPGMVNDIVRYANVGLLCVQDKAADRPNVSTVLSMLSCEIVELPRPKKPAFFGIQSSLETESSGENLSKSSLNEVSVTIGEGGR